jgi:hypothetical protein
MLWRTQQPCQRWAGPVSNRPAVLVLALGPYSSPRGGPEARQARAQQEEGRGLGRRGQSVRVPLVGQEPRPAVRPPLIFIACGAVVGFAGCTHGNDSTLARHVLLRLGTGVLV